MNFKSIGFFLLILFIGSELKAQFAPPYTQYFDVNSTGWTHYGAGNVDDWELGTPTVGPAFAYSHPNVWATNLMGNAATNAGRYLQSPVFDLTDTTESWYLQFRHALNAHNVSGNGSFQYSIDTGNTWVTLNGTSQEKYNWFNSGNNWSGSIGAYTRVTHSLDSLAGEPHVQFRFSFSTSTTTSTGWQIDHFEILKEQYNITAISDDTLTGLTRNSPDQDVPAGFTFENPFGQPLSGQTRYYFSEDSVLDINDTLIKTSFYTPSNDYISYMETLTLPQGVNAGYHYIFYHLDATDVLQESDENDNIGRLVLKFDSTIQSAYVENFENILLPWDSLNPYNQFPHVWEVGSGWTHHLENAHSGQNAFHTSKGEEFAAPNFDQIVYSPHFELSAFPSNAVINFWYKIAENQQDVVYTYNGTWGNTLFTITPPASDDWEFTNHPLHSIPDNGLDARLGFKVRLGGSFGGDPLGWSFDDLYIGPSKPDISIERDLERTLSSLSPIDTIRYHLVNSGNVTALNLHTTFWWSQDSILDSADQQLFTLVNVSFPPLTDSVTSFVLNKPTQNPGVYYLFYQLDTGNVIDEMREYNNTGYFRLRQEAPIPIPYFNDFETQVDGWYTSTTLNKNEWAWSSPTGSVLNSSFSGSKAWITNDTGNVAHMSRMHLYTNAFDLQNSMNPVLEFSMHNDLFDSGNGSAGNSGANIHYSTDKSLSWHVLDTVGTKNSTRMYSLHTYDDHPGQDKIFGKYHTDWMLLRNEWSFESTQYYQTRFSDRSTKYMVDIGFLKGERNVRFRFNYANALGDVEGVLIDDFKIREKHVDLTVDRAEQRNLILSTQDNRIKFTMWVKNQGNVFSPATTIRYFVSTDSILDAGDPVLGNENVPEIRGDYKALIKASFLKPSNVGTYKYLFYLVDPDSTVDESNDFDNNEGYWPLGFQTPEIPPYFNDFNGPVIDGWDWDHTAASWDEFQFRTKPLVGEAAAYQPQGGSWFLDRMNQVTGLNFYPTFYLESPTFDLSLDTGYIIKFDFICVGFFGEGGNAQFSTNGGNSWAVIHPGIGNSTPQNWYSATSSVNSLGGEQGWTGSTAPSTWTPAEYDVSFLAGQSNVKFRFQFKGNDQAVSPGVHGFRLDNFSVLPKSFGINIKKDDLNCPSDQSGKIMGLAGGGTPPYQWVWSNSSTADTLTNLGPGWYFVTVSDSTGLTISDSIQILEPAPSPVSVLLNSVTDTVSCYSGTEGILTATGSGGVGPLTFMWSHCETSPVAKGLSGGTYTVTVSDGCTSDTASYTLVSPSTPINIHVDSTGPLTCQGLSDGFLALSATGGGGGYTYEWSNGIVDSVNQNLEQGLNTVTVTDSYGCEEIRNWQIVEVFPLLSSIQVSHESCEGERNGIIVVNPGTGAPPYTYIFDSDTTTVNQMDSLAPGFYPLTVIDSQGCMVSDTVEILTINDRPNVYLGPDEILCIGDSTFLQPIFLIYEEYLWSTGASTPTISVSDSGQYSITITDQNGCTNDDTILVILDTCGVGISPVLASQLAIDIDVFPNPFRTITTVASNNRKPFQFSIVDVLGNAIVPPKNSGMDFTGLNLAGVSPGVYFLIAEQEGKKTRIPIVKLE